MCYTFSTTKLPELVYNIQLSSAPCGSWVEDWPQGGQWQQRGQGALCSWASSNIEQLQASLDPLPSISSRTFAQVPRGFPGGSEVKASACNAGDLGSIPELEDPLEKEMATHSSILAWEIPRTEEPGGLQSTTWQKSWT